ncbi:unnamed protein product [Polarella glacialis]|uniref:Uncharacterized protein n=1 Tax=Polarella glacialis TaxID=89957 RepID=A0A813DL82_POLGL|nr:unnamed protein product [Polarella glacialis]
MFAAVRVHSPRWLWLAFLFVVFQRLIVSMICLVLRSISHVFSRPMATTVQHLWQEAKGSSSSISGLLFVFESVLIVMFESLLFHYPAEQHVSSMLKPAAERIKSNSEFRGHYNNSNHCKPATEVSQWPAFFRGIETTVFVFVVKEIWQSGDASTELGVPGQIPARGIINGEGGG